MDARSEDSSGQRRTTELGGCTLRELLLQSAAAKLRHWAATLRKSPTTAATATESSTTNPITNTSTSLPSLRRKKPRAPSKRLRPKVVPGEAELLQWIAETDYEINVDPYRGIQSLLMEQQQQQQQAAATALREGPAVEDLTFDDDEEVEISQRLAAGPWRSRCSFGFGCTSTNCTTATAANVPMAAQSAPPSEHDSEESAVVVELPPPPQQQIVQKVRATCQSTCPTLIQWTMLAVQEQFKTQKQQQQKKKKRPRAAEKNCGSDDDDDQPQTHVWGRRRFANPRQRCACDYNPFCLGTLGGAMDEILHEWSSSPSRRPPEQVNNDDDVVEVAPSDGYGNAECHSIVDSVTQSWDDLSCPFYSFQTLEMLRAVRKFKMIDETVVRSYLQTVLQNLTAAMSLDEGVHRVRQLHQSLIFRNPLLDDDDERTREYTVSEKGQKGRNLPLSLPPGIENLGATCYLNTQLQCLAQNRVFVQGIMSWRASKGAGVDDRMSSVLSLFQDLLVRMNAGPRSTLNTIEFSNTLGLDHYEQQDPNEFSRLLFEKMHESFQKEKTSQGGNLAELLPHLFQGVMMYETTCLTCKAKSSRTEEFMDLNLPIVHPKLPKKPGQQSILDTFAAQLDTDVQTCLGMYCHPETLDGDNQYLCSQCGGKRDAKRELTFQTLPPVLNIQLSRYVFDREKLMKKKLSDKVLLPLDLRVKALSKQLNLGSVEHRYVLCAVMRHKGISAHSGHYVAEAMDWLTGQWFEFNDEKVVLLDDGPSCSYDPTALDDKEQVPMAVGVQRRKATGLAGSQDAYNMYYVEETFLAQSALDGLRRGSDAEVSGESASVVEKIAVERSEFYADLSQMCMDDGKAAKRLERRREIIRTKMFPNFSACQISNPDDLVWVESTPLLQFMSCRDRLQERLEHRNDRAVFQHHDLLCSHEPPGLPPRVARKGKLLPKLAYEAYVAALREEQRALLGGNNDAKCFSECLILPTDNLICKECSDDYGFELLGKRQKIVKFKDLYDALDPKEMNFSLDLGVDYETYGDRCDRYAYIVSRKFITWFRNKVAHLMKQAACSAANATSVDCSNEFLALRAENVAEGLDGLDLSELEVGSLQNVGPGEVDDESISSRVNGPITCLHGNFDNVSAMSFRYVRWSTWTKIKALFPNAIEFKRKRIGFPEDLGDDVDNDLCGCMQCRANGIAQTCLRSNLSDFTQFCQGSRNCEALANEVVLEMSKLQGSTAQFRLLHKADMLAWRKFVAAFKRKDDKKRNESLEEMVKKALFPSSSNNASRCFPLNQLNNKPARVDLQRLEFLSKIFRPIVCKTHGRPIYDALFQVVDNPANQKYGFLTDNICILDENDYKDFLAYVVAVAVILFPSDKNLISEGSMVHAFTSEAAIFSDTWRIDSVSHPTFVPVPLNGDQRDSDLFCVSTENLAMVFQLDGASCHDEICCRDFAHWLASEGTLEEPKVSPLEVRTKEQPESLGVVNDPITVDSDFESGSVTEPFSLRVFDVKADSDLDLALEALSRCTGLLTSEEADENQFLRRSSRKRKSRYPVGVIQDEETVRADMNNNIAALRLLLLERCTKGSQFELDHTLRLVLRTCAKDEGQIVVDLDGGKEEDVISSTQFLSKVKVVDLTFNLNCETLRSICEEAVGEKMEQSINQSESIMLLRQASEDNSSKAIPKDAMMDHFIGLANTTAEVSSTGKRPCSNTALNKKSRTEKGFTGTFLSSTALSKATDIIEEASAEPTKVVKHADAHLNCNEGYSPSEPLKPTVSVMEGSMHVLVDAVDLYARQEVSIIEDNRIVEHDKRTWNEESYRRTDLYDNKGKTTEPGSDTQSFVKDTNPVTELLTSSKVVESDNVFSHSNSSKYFNELKPEAASTSGEVRQCLTNSHKPNGSRAQSRDFFEDNSDDEIELLRSPFTKVSPQRWASKRTRRTTVTGKVSVLVATSQKPDDCPDRGRRQSTKDHNLVSEIVRMLLSNPDIQRKDEQMCQMAAENAIQMHPEVKDANRLVDPAYSLYLEFTLP